MPHRCLILPVSDIVGMPYIVDFYNYLGSGKSSGAYKFACELQDESKENGRQYVIYTNIKVLEDRPHKPLDIRRLIFNTINALDFEDQYIIWLFDEIEQYFDARASQEQKARIYSYFIYQVRKRKHHLICTSPNAYLADIRLRNEINFWVECEKRDYLTKGLCTDADCTRQHYFKYVWRNALRNNKKVATVRVADIDLYGRFDSYAIDAPINAMSKDQIDKLYERWEFDQDHMNEQRMKDFTDDIARRR